MKNKKVIIGAVIGGAVALGLGAWYMSRVIKKREELEGNLPPQVDSKGNPVSSGSTSVGDIIADANKGTNVASGGFDPSKDAEAVFNALSGWTTEEDEKSIVDLLKKRTKAQRKAIANYFDNSEFSEGWTRDKMKDWLESDLSEENWNTVKGLMSY